MIAPLIMAGGVGSRFWPLSRKHKPKQFLNLVDRDRSMLQTTVDRINKLTDYENIFIATTEEYQEEMKKHLPELLVENIIVEPMRKNTAACIGLASLYIKRKDPNAIMVVLPADHLIIDEERFLSIVESAIEFIKEEDALVTLGIEPTYPSTGYGYIKYGTKYTKTINVQGIFEVENFIEKPNLDRANQFFAQENYLWNSGMFVWKVSTILNLIEIHMPKLHKGLEKIKDAIGTDKEEEVLKNEFEKLDDISIDYGIMEKTDQIYVIPSNFGWDDVGSWPALERIEKKDKQGNVIRGHHIGIGTKNTIVHGDKKIITTVGIEDLVIVDTEDAILICGKNRAQEVKEIRSLLEDKGLGEYL